MTKLIIQPLLISLVLLIGYQPTVANQPNILVIMVDDLGYGDLSSYGSEDLQTPAIDSIVGNDPRLGPLNSAVTPARVPKYVIVLFLLDFCC